MNNRQKLVQQQFLNNEEAVIKRLKQVYDKSSNDINDKIKNLTFKIDELQEQYDWMDPDDPERAKIKSQIQSKIYQKQYQEQLRSQVDGILKQMQTKSYLTVSDYLDECYEDGFIGTIFDAHGQGVPIVTPIDQEAMVRAVQLDSKISQGLYTRLGEDVNLLKRKIMAQVSRSISTGMTYAQTAQQLAGYTKIGYNNAVRIARTEGHRVQTTATMHAMTKARDKGADVLKQWDSTLDGRTRDSHHKVDGEIRELGDKFSNGLDYPGDPHGKAAEVINCRCALLQRASWALDDDELQTLKDRAEYFGLDKSDNFDDFKKKYLKATKTSDPYSFTDEESNAIEWYVSGDGQYINQYFRGNVGGDFGDLSDAEKKFAKTLDKVTDRVLPDDINSLYRSTDASAVFGDLSDDDWYNLEQYITYGGDSFGKGAYADKIRQKAENILNKTNGKVITEKGFMSTTKKIDVAEDWGSFTGSDKPVTLEFDSIPKGLKGADLKMFDIEGDEQFEVLLARNTKYKITDIYEKNGQVHVKATFILDDVADTVDDIQKVVTKQKFVPAKTIEEAETFIKDYVTDSHWSGTGISYSGISVESANRVNKVLSELYDTFDMEKLGGIFVAKGNTKLGKAVEGATAAYSPIRKSLILNNRSMKNVDDVAKNHLEELKMIQNYAKNPSAYTFKSKSGERLAKASVKSGRATVPDTIDGVIHHEMGHHLEATVKKSNNYETVRVNMNRYAENLSGYATTNENEYIAESFASYMKGENRIDPVLAKIFDSMKR